MNDPNYTLAQAQESSTDLWLNIPLYNALAEQGNMDAQHRLAQNYIWLHKYTEALHWGLKAAEQGQIDAMLLIATIYGYNFKKYKNLKEQIKWLKKAVALKSIDAHIALAHTYLLALDEYSEYTDINKGISLLKCVVEQVDHPEALHLLSIFDKQNAKKWLILGSQKEQIRSIISLIELLWKEEEFEEAYNWVLIAEKILKQKIINLDDEAEILVKKALCYINGWGITQNLDKAKKYLRAAKKIESHDYASKILKTLS